jgi:glycosyltransferase involved in cell wall biosynthesis
MAASVTAGILIYKRLSFLPNVLKSVSQQDYSNLELIVSVTCFFTNETEMG